MTEYKFQVLNGNILKLIALAAMTIDHIGLILLSGDATSEIYLSFRIIGRLAFPIFAFMIAEGCYYTRSRAKYLGLMFAVGVLCQAAAFFFGRSLYQCTLITFSMSLAIIFALKKALPDRDGEDSLRKRRAVSPLWCVISGLFIAAAAFITFVLPDLLEPALRGLKIASFHVDYGFFGVMLPVWVYAANFFMPRRGAALRLVQTALLAAGLIPVILDTALKVQIYSLFAVILILLYNGKRGKAKLKYLFYIYYPLHLGIIYLISEIV